MYIDFNRIKRFFAFGCSYTQHMWPSWADVISHEMPNAEFYNAGKSGAGNLLISLRLSELNARYQFTEDDLVMVMFTSHTREDRWLSDKGWLTGGNIYNNDVYNKDWVKKFCDPDWYLIRDYGILTLAQSYVKSLPCQHVLMVAHPIGSAETSVFDSDISREVNDIYYSLAAKFPRSLVDVICSNFSNTGHTYYDELIHGNFHDGHYTPVQYLKYLEEIGLPVTDKSRNYALDAEKRLRQHTNRLDIINEFEKELELGTNFRKF